jgi:hypothetical protein
MRDALSNKWADAPFRQFQLKRVGRTSRRTHRLRDGA